MDEEKVRNVGELTIEIDRARKRLNKRRCDAQHMVKTLRVLADCFDEQEEDVYITQIEGEWFDCTHPDANLHPHEVKKLEDFLVFPTGLAGIATEIRDLEIKIESVDRRLRAELDCD